jgi:chitinase
MLKELKTRFLKDNLILTAAVGAGKATIDAGYEIAEISKYLDFVNLMAYVILSLI